MVYTIISVESCVFGFCRIVYGCRYNLLLYLDGWEKIEPLQLFKTLTTQKKKEKKKKKLTLHHSVGKPFAKPLTLPSNPAVRDKKTTENIPITEEVEEIQKLQSPPSKDSSTLVQHPMSIQTYEVLLLIFFFFFFFINFLSYLLLSITSIVI